MSMKKVVSGEALKSLLGERVVLLCLNYIYVGVLEGVDTDCVLLAEPSIVYETGEWSAATWKDAQRLHCEKLYVQRGAIESFGVGK
jgi:hypothetical protein